MAQTSGVLRDMETILQKHSAVDTVLDIAGFSFVGQGENVGLGFICLKSNDLHCVYVGRIATRNLHWRWCQ